MLLEAVCNFMPFLQPFHHFYRHYVRVQLVAIWRYYVLFGDALPCVYVNLHGVLVVDDNSSELCLLMDKHMGHHTEQEWNGHTNGAKAQQPENISNCQKHIGIFDI